MIHITFSPFDLKPARRDLIMNLLALDLAERVQEHAKAATVSSLAAADVAVLGRQLAEYNKTKSP